MRPLSCTISSVPTVCAAVSLSLAFSDLSVAAMFASVMYLTKILSNTGDYLLEFLIKQNITIQV